MGSRIDDSTLISFWRQHPERRGYLLLAAPFMIIGAILAIIYVDILKLLGRKDENPFYDPTYKGGPK